VKLLRQIAIDTLNGFERVGVSVGCYAVFIYYLATR